MNVTLLLVALVVFAFFVGHVLNRYVSKYIALSGAEYLLVGALIGPHVPPRLVTTDSLDKLVPLMSLLLGLTGFLVGLRVRRAFASFRYAVVGTLGSLGVFVCVAGACATLAVALRIDVDTPVLLNRELFAWKGWAIDLRLTSGQAWVGLALAAAAPVAATGLLGTVGETLGARSPTFALLKTAAEVGQLFAIVAIGIVLAAARGASGAFFQVVGGWGWLGGAFGLGLVCGGCFMLFIGSEKSTSRIFLATVGTVIFASGVGTALGVSPLFVNLAAGLTVALASRHGDTLRRELSRLQHPIFVLLLILTGAFWTPTSGLGWLFPLVYVAVRLVSVRLLYRWLALVLPNVHRPRVGLGLVAQGTLAVAVAVDFALQVPEHASLVLTTVLVGTLLSDVSAGGVVRRLLVDAESSSIPERAVVPPPSTATGGAP